MNPYYAHAIPAFTTVINNPTTSPSRGGGQTNSNKLVVREGVCAICKGDSAAGAGKSHHEDHQWMKNLIETYRQILFPLFTSSSQDPSLFTRICTLCRNDFVLLRDLREQVIKIEVEIHTILEHILTNYSKPINPQQQQPLNHQQQPVSTNNGCGNVISASMSDQITPRLDFDVLGLNIHTGFVKQSQPQLILNDKHQRQLEYEHSVGVGRQSNSSSSSPDSASTSINIPGGQGQPWIENQRAQFEQRNMKPSDMFDPQRKFTPIQCDFCSEIYRDQETLEIHKRNRHSFPFGGGGGSSFYISRQLKQHLEKEHHIFVCGVCGISLSSRTELRSHNKKIHEKQSPDVANSFDAKQGEQGGRCGGGTFPCQYCGKCYSTKSILAIHVRNFHSKEDGSSKTSPSFSKKHSDSNNTQVEKHSFLGVKPGGCNQCPLCQKTLTSTGLERGSTRTVKEETGPSPNHQQKLKLQQQQQQQQQQPDSDQSSSMDDRKTLSCIHCGRVFSHPTALFHHEKIVCNEDKEEGERWRRKRAEKQRLYRNQGRPFNCHLCHKKYAIKDNLQLHLKKEHPSTNCWGVDVFQ